MDNIGKIKEKLKNDPKLLELFNTIIHKPRERNEIYIYCLQRQTLDSKIHYIPLITFWGENRQIMACNNLMQLQMDYEKEVIMYKLHGYPISIVEVSFETYLNLSIDLERYLNTNFVKDSFLENIKKLKTEALFSNVELNEKSLPKNMLQLIQDNNNYCKCLNDNFEIVDCTNYKPIIPLAHLDGDII